MQAFALELMLKYVVSACLTFFCTFIVISINAKKEKKSYFKIACVSRFNVKFVFISLLGFLGVFFGFGFVNLLIKEALTSFGLNVAKNEIVINGFGELVIWLVFVCVFPAVSEECFFRGLILSQFEESKKIGGIILTSVLFAFYHASLTMFVYQLIFGAVLAVLRVKSQSVVSGAVIHFLNNAVIVICAYFKINVNLNNPWLIFTGLILFALFWFFIVKSPDKTVCKKEKVQSKIFCVYSLLGILICFLQIILSLFV